MSSIKKWKLLQKYATTISSDFIKKLYLKDGLLAIYKPYGIPVQTGPKVKHSITDLFPGLEKQYNLPNGSLELANRLDKNVAGVLLLTYEKKMAAQIALMQRDRLIEKKYLSILVGQSTSRFGTLKGDIVESDRSMKYKQTIVKHQVKPRAVTQFKILDNNMDTCMLCEFRTNTGYKHQVRLHASEFLNLIEELGGKDIEDIVKEMEVSEFRASMEQKLPAFNTRVKLPTVSERMAGFDDDDDSGDDDDYLSRNAIKRNSQQIVDAKTKKHKARPKTKNKK